MPLFKSKVFFMALGLILGFILGLLSYDKILDNKKEKKLSVRLTTEQGLPKQPTKEPVRTKAPKSTHNNSRKTSSTTKRKQKKNKAVAKGPTADSLATQEPKNDSLKHENSTISAPELSDSLDEYITVAKEKMIYQTRILPSGERPDYFCLGNRALDSSLVNSTSRRSSDTLMVEFWLSPVNFKGYRFNKRLLMLYGIMDFDSVKLEFRQDENLWLLYKGGSYRLNCSSEYNPLNFHHNKVPK